MWENDRLRDLFNRLRRMSEIYTLRIFEYYFIYLVKLISEVTMTLIKTKHHVTIARRDWEKMKTNPAVSEAIELLEDISDLEKAKKVRGKSVTIEQYKKRRGIQSSR